MSVLKFTRTAAAAAALAIMPAHAIAASADSLPMLAASVAVQDEGATTAEDEGQPFFQSEYFFPALIVIVLALTLYFVLSDEEETTPLPAPPVSP
jgi:hypothetical protein